MFLWQFHSIDDSAEEVNASQIDLKALNAQPLKRFDSDKQYLNVGAFARTAVVFDSDLREFALPSAFRFFESQDFAGVVEPNGLRGRCQPRRNRLRDERCKFRPERKD